MVVGSGPISATGDRRTHFDRRQFLQHGDLVTDIVNSRLLWLRVVTGCSANQLKRTQGMIYIGHEDLFVCDDIAAQVLGNPQVSEQVSARIVDGYQNLASQNRRKFQGDSHAS